MLTSWTGDSFRAFDMFSCMIVKVFINSLYNMWSLFLCPWVWLGDNNIPYWNITEVMLGYVISKCLHSSFCLVIPLDSGKARSLCFESSPWASWRSSYKKTLCCKELPVLWLRNRCAPVLIKPSWEFNLLPEKCPL